MPSGKVHYHYFKIGFIPAIPVSLITLVYFPYVGTGMLVGYAMGRYVTPDWDIMGVSEDEGKMVREIPILGYFLYGISSTYGAIFRRLHRNYLTHFPMLSTFIRLVFLFWWLPLLLYFVKISSHAWGLYGDMFFGILIGLSLADAIHWFLDLLTEQEKFREYFRRMDDTLE